MTKRESLLKITPYRVLHLMAVAFLLMLNFQFRQFMETQNENTRDINVMKQDLAVIKDRLNIPYRAAVIERPAERKKSLPLYKLSEIANAG
jgi:hypothetical protein